LNEEEGLKMTRRLCLAGLLVGLCSLSSAGDVKAEPTTKRIASSYFEALMTGDVARANELASVPYSFDRKEVLEKKEDVAAKHQEILTKKGKREVPKYTTAVPDNAPALDPKTFPGHTVVRILIEGCDDHVDIYVTTGEHPKVIGFSD
jgi:hypothetical protein